MKLTGQVRRAMIALAALAVGPAVSRGQATAPAPPSYPNFRVGGRLHVHAYWLDNDAYAPVLGPESSFFIRRARIEVTGQVSEAVSFVIQPSFENAAGREPNLRLRDAYVTVQLTAEGAPTALALRFGQEKRPFNRYELLSSHNLPSIERGAGRGLVSISANRLFEENGFLAHDLGASLHMVILRAVALHAGVYNGQGESFTDVNDGKSYGVRGTAELSPKLSLGAGFFSHDGIVTVPPDPPATSERVDSAFRTTAYGIDGAWGRPGNSGLFVIADYGWGERFGAGAEPMGGGSAVAAYNFRTRRGVMGIHALEPVLRFDYADPNRRVANDEVRLISAVFGVYLASRAQLRIAYERQSFSDPLRTPIAGMRSAMTIGF